MTKRETIELLKHKIEQALTPLIRSDYVLLDLPYHTNIGDTLIWEGELHFLAGLPYKMLGSGSMKTWGFPPLDKQTTILLHGGGNFGDIWHGPRQFRLKVIESYPDNPIIILPQTVFYSDSEHLRHDAQAMSKHSNLTICARDNVSWATLNEHFRNNILLLPDMAFCIPPQRLEYKQGLHHKETALVMDRTDRERVELVDNLLPADRHIHDWPTMERLGFSTWLIYKLSGVSGRVSSTCAPLSKGVDVCVANRVRNSNIRAGVNFMGPYDKVFSSRLHGAILAILMDKSEVYILDNSYGKNSNFYNTWLSDTQGVEMMENR